ncbi:MAG TPA: hypothetical protein VG322_11345 [Candidatus Acidoferrales bacterium]|jgi:hypothetical protein|nr:hypothetical protein [Candidatus Acidoferrales bacterium]
MTGDSAHAFWYCVVVRDPLTGRYQHYRCFWTEREADVYKLQLQQMGDRTERSSQRIAIETLPGGELPQRVLQ